jgi:Zn-dependent M16 (insulinase) family peptidase
MEKKEYMKKWREKNKEYIKEYIKKYKEENKEHVLAVQRVLNHKNYEKKCLAKQPKQPNTKVKPIPKPIPKLPIIEPRFKIMKGVFIQF